MHKCQVWIDSKLHCDNTAASINRSKPDLLLFSNFCTKVFFSSFSNSNTCWSHSIMLSWQFRPTIYCWFNGVQPPKSIILKFLNWIRNDNWLKWGTIAKSCIAIFLYWIRNDNWFEWWTAWRAQGFITSMDSGMMIDWSEEQPWKAAFPISFTESEMIIDCSDEHSAKAQGLFISTDSGMVMDCSLEQPLKTS